MIGTVSNLIKIFAEPIEIYTKNIIIRVWKRKMKKKKEKLGEYSVLYTLKLKK